MTKASTHIGSLESTRGIAAMMVAVFHCGPSHWNNSNLVWDYPSLAISALRFLYHTLCNGHGAVIYFFVLSGFVLSMSAEKHNRLDWSWALQFSIRRMVRIYPAVFFSLFLFYLTYLTGLTVLYGELFEITNVVVNALALLVNINGPMWTIQLELLAIPIVAICLMAIRERRERLLWVLLAVMTIAATKTPLMWLFGPRFSPPGYLVFFIAGVLCHEMGKRIKTFPSPKATSRLRFMLVALFFSVRPMLGGSSKWIILLEGAIAGLFIISCVYGPSESRWKHLESRPLRLFGKISYSFYLLHPLCLLLGMAFLQNFPEYLGSSTDSLITSLCLASITIAVTLPLAWVSWRFVEMPAMSFISAQKAQSIKIRNVSEETFHEQETLSRKKRAAA